MLRIIFSLLSLFFFFISICDIEYFTFFKELFLFVILYGVITKHYFLIMKNAFLSYLAKKVCTLYEDESKRNRMRRFSRLELFKFYTSAIWNIRNTAALKDKKDEGEEDVL